jgi:uncharacterized protein
MTTQKLRGKISPIIRLTDKCNLRCKYCYVGDSNRESMHAKTLKLIISELGTVSDQLNFIWHGGEPLLAGLHTYRKIIQEQKKLSNGLQIKNRLQSNGTLINKRYIDFFKKNNFGVGVSVDGPDYLHDLNRIFPDGSGTHETIMKNIGVIRKTNPYAKTSCIAVLSKSNLKGITDVYDFFQIEGLRFKLNPIAVTKDSALGITGKEYGASLIRLYDHIVATKGTVECRTLEEFRNGVTKGSVRECFFRGECSRDFIGFDPLGNVYNCSRFASHTDTAIGNIHDMPLIELLQNEKYLTLKRNPDELGCSACYWKSICNGGCSYEAYASYGNPHRKTPFCDGHKMIFDHIAAKEGAVMTQKLPFT